MVIIGTEKSKHLEKGVEYTVTEEIGKILIDKGDAYEKGNEPKPKKAPVKRKPKATKKDA